MSSNRRMWPIFTFLLILPIVWMETLQEESCCSRNAGSTKTKSIATSFGCICKEVTVGYTICYNVNNGQNSCKMYPSKIAINTTELIIRSTSIEKLHDNDFSNLEHLDTLTIDQNAKLNHIHGKIFKKTTYLRILNIMSSPLLTTFESDTFEGLTNLKELKVVNCGFSRMLDLTIALKVRILPNLQKLNISGNKFLNITSNDISQMTDETLNQKSLLEELDISSCGIEMIENEAFNSLDKLTNLNIGNNSIPVSTLVDLLQTASSSNVALKSLDLHSFRMNEIVPRPISRYLAASSINTLTLSGNSFDFLQQDSIPNSLVTLKTLDLTDVKTTFLDSTFFTRIPNLEKLIFNKHNLSYFTLPRSLPNLKYLDLSEFTRKGSWEFFHLETEVDVTKIEYLDLHSTRLAFLLKDSFKFMPALKELNLKKCIIAKISTGAFNQLENLKYLNLEDNKFFIMHKRYPSEPFLGLDNLETLLVGGNAISQIDFNGRNLFKHLTNLKCLGLQRNSLEVITPEDFEPLQNLQILDVSSNPLYAWDDRVFLKLQLEKFYASSNHFSYLSQAMIEDFFPIKTLDIDYSPFSCDCRMVRRMYPNHLLMRVMEDSPRYQNLLCSGSHELKVLDFLKTTKYEDCEPKKSHMMYFFWTFLAIAFVAAIMILVYIVKDQIPYVNAFVRSTESRQSIL